MYLSFQIPEQASKGSGLCYHSLIYKFVHMLLPLKVFFMNKCLTRSFFMELLEQLLFDSKEVLQMVIICIVIL